MSKEDVSLASQFCRDCHMRYNCDNITEYICLSNDFCKYIKDFRPVHNKKTMELVWHNCKSCPPKELFNESLVVTDGVNLYRVRWDQEVGYFGNHCLIEVSMNGSENWWWADLYQTTTGFFRQ